MKLFKQRYGNKPFSEKLAKRVKKVPTSELASWAETSLADIGRCLSQYEKTRDELYIKEALTGAEAVNALISELYDRTVV